MALGRGATAAGAARRRGRGAPGPADQWPRPGGWWRPRAETVGALVSLQESGRPDGDAHVLALRARPGMRAAGMPEEGGVLEVVVVVTARWLLV